MAAYNTFTYNTRRYNTDIFSVVLSESISNIDSDVEDIVLGQLDFVFMSEFFRMDVTNKGLSDTIRLGDWLSVRQSPQSNDWGN